MNTYTSKDNYDQFFKYVNILLKENTKIKFFQTSLIDHFSTHLLNKNVHSTCYKKGKDVAYESVLESTNDIVFNNFTIFENFEDVFSYHLKSKINLDRYACNDQLLAGILDGILFAIFDVGLSNQFNPFNFKKTNN